MKRSKLYFPSLLGKYLVLGAAALLVLLPVVYTLSNSLMSTNEISRYYNLIHQEGARTIFHILPDRISLNGYYQILLRRPDYLLKFWNSLVYTSLIVGGQVLISCLAGYAFARFRFPGRDILFFLVIILMMMPYQVTLVANYIVLDRMNLIGSWASVILPAVFSPFGVFLIRQSIASLPEELAESARLDGAGQICVLMKIILPNCKGGLASLVILSFIDNWNMVEQPLVFLRHRRQYPLSIFLSQMNSSVPELGFACGILAMIPVILLYFFFEQELMEGITVSSLK